MIIECKYCGKKFVKQTVHQKYCSVQCRKSGFYYGEKNNNGTAQVENEKPKYKSELARLNAEARAHGMSYGQYVSKYGL